MPLSVLSEAWYTSVQVLRAVMNLNRQKRRVREQRLAAIPESDCEKELLV